MLTRLLIAAALLVTACQPAASATTVVTIETAATEVASPPAVQATEDTPSTAEPPEWVETRVGSVTFGMWKPAGWDTDQNNGLVLAEHTVSMQATATRGMLVYCFVPPKDEFQVSASGNANFALAVLNEAVRSPSHTGHDVVFSQPTGFIWDGHQAAYYLLVTGNGMRGVVLALALPGERQVVACNVSIAASQSYRIRPMLPHLLDGLTVDGTVMGGAALDTLPDPLPFPPYNAYSHYMSGDAPP